MLKIEIKEQDKKILMENKIYYSPCILYINEENKKTVLEEFKNKNIIEYSISVVENKLDKAKETKFIKKRKRPKRNHPIRPSLK